MLLWNDLIDKFSSHAVNVFDKILTYAGLALQGEIDLNLFSYFNKGNYYRNLERWKPALILKVLEHD
jgi:hypothetical protein